MHSCSFVTHCTKTGGGHMIRVPAKLNTLLEATGNKKIGDLYFYVTVGWEDKENKTKKVN